MPPTVLAASGSLSTATSTLGTSSTASSSAVVSLIAIGAPSSTTSTSDGPPASASLLSTTSGFTTSGSTTSGSTTSGIVGVFASALATPSTSVTPTTSGSSSVGIASTVLSTSSPTSTFNTTSTVKSGPTVPLLTIFTPDAVCTQGAWVSVNSTQGIVTCTRALVDAFAAQCYPNSFEALQTSSGIYSPGVCPHDYSAASTWTGSRGDQTSICCLSGMNYVQTASACVMLITGSTLMSSGGQTVTNTAPFSAIAPTIAVAWATSDLASFTPSGAPVLQEATSTTTGNPALSTGAQAGIGVGAGVGGLALVGVGVWLLLRRKRMKKERPSGNVSAHDKAELSGQPLERQTSGMTELGDGSAVHQMDGRGKPAEVHANARYELEGEWRGFEAPNSPTR